MSREDSLATIINALDVALLERRAPGVFAIIGQLPRWFLRLYPDLVAAQELRLAKASPFAADVESQTEIATVSSEIPDIAMSAQAVVTSMTPGFTVSQVELQLDPQAEWTKDWRVVGEKSRLERVLTNLVENALRHSPRGSTVTIGVREEQGRVLTTVDDEGPGVSQELAEHLFQEFVQGNHKTGRVSLGLYFCHITIERWGERSATRHEQAEGRDFGFASLAP